MPSVDLGKLYDGMQQEMEAGLKTGASVLMHPGMKGDDTEDNWREWLMAYLPNRYAVAKGVVIDADGNESEQIDVIIYDRQYSYLVLKHNETFLIPAESVYAVFEVKQSLNKGYMEYAQHKTESVRKLKRTSVAIKHAGGKYDPKPLHKIVAGLLTTTSDWAESSTIDNIANNLSENELKRLDMICCVAAGTFVCDRGDKTISYCDKSKSLVYFLSTCNNTKKKEELIAVPINCYFDKGFYAAIYYTKGCKILKIQLSAGKSAIQCIIGVDKDNLDLLAYLYYCTITQRTFFQYMAEEQKNLKDYLEDTHPIMKLSTAINSLLKSMNIHRL